MKENLPALPPLPAGKKYFKISEAVTYCGVRQDVLRFWESQISQLKPIRRGTQRRYRPQDILIARHIRELRYGQGLSIEGVKEALKKEKETIQIVPVPNNQPSLQKQDGNIDLFKLKKITNDLKELREFLRNK